jgi:hypothetical protein
MTQAELSQAIFALLGTGGGLALIFQAVRAIVKWMAGSEARRQLRRRSAEQQIAEARDERDKADSYRRVIAEHASRWRRMLLEAGIDPGPWPENPNDPHPPKETP